MSPLVPPLLFAAFAWWIGTGVLFLAGGLGERGRRRVWFAISVAAAAALVCAWAGRNAASPAGAYAAFLCGLTIWAWNEAAFVFGLALGSRRAPCPPDARGFRRFSLAFEALAHHELMIVLSGAALALATFGGANPVAIATFALLWLMRVSAKMNLFLGVPSFSDGLMPARLAHLKSYFRRRAMNLLWPLSMLVACGIAWVAVTTALAATATPFVVTASALIGAIAALAALEHLFLVLPWSDDRLWRWLRRRPAAIEGGVLSPLSSTTGGETSGLNSRRPL